MGVGHSMLVGFEWQSVASLHLRYDCRSNVSGFLKIPSERVDQAQVRATPPLGNLITRTKALEIFITLFLGMTQPLRIQMRGVLLIAEGVMMVSHAGVRHRW